MLPKAGQDDTWMKAEGLDVGPLGPAAGLTNQHSPGSFQGLDLNPLYGSHYLFNFLNLFGHIILFAHFYFLPFLFKLYRMRGSQNRAWAESSGKLTDV